MSPKRYNCNISFDVFAMYNYRWAILRKAGNHLSWSSAAPLSFASFVQSGKHRPPSLVFRFSETIDSCSCEMFLVFLKKWRSSWNKKDHVCVYKVFSMTNCVPSFDIYSNMLLFIISHTSYSADFDWVIPRWSLHRFHGCRYCFDLIIIHKLRFICWHFSCMKVEVISIFIFSNCWTSSNYTGLQRK